MKEKPLLLSVIMITYGHESFIKQAVEGVLNQKCDFNFELVIANDCSPDNTDEIVNNIIENHPQAHKIKYIKQKSNIGMMPNFIYAVSSGIGKYIALCEGDDYWVDPLKVQKQIDFLEANPEFNFSMGRVDVLIQKSGEIKKMIEHVDPNIKEIYTLKDYIKNPFSQTSSFVFKNSKEPFPDWFYNVHAGDQSLVILKTGITAKIKYHKDLFSIYRVNESSVSFDLDLKKLKKRGDFFLDNINEFTSYKYNYIIVIRKFINKLYSYSKSKNLIVKYPSLILYRLLFNLVQKL